MKNCLTRKSERISLTVLCVLFFVYAVTLAFPFLWLLYNACKGADEFWADPWALPQNFFGNFANYGIIFVDFDMLTMFFNTLFMSAAMATLSVFFHCCVAYAYAQHEFRLKKLLIVFVPIDAFHASPRQLALGYSDRGRRRVKVGFLFGDDFAARRNGNLFSVAERFREFICALRGVVVILEDARGLTVLGDVERGLFHHSAVHFDKPAQDEIFRISAGTKGKFAL